MQSVAVLDRHQLVWRDPPVWPFMWRGLVPLAALALLAVFALGPFARGTVQAGVEQEIREQLRTAGFGWVDVHVSGQSVSLAGEEPAAGAGQSAVALARGATCPTFLGRRTCATQVAARFTAPAPAPVPAQPPLAAAPPAAAGSAALPAHGTPAVPAHTSAAQACEHTLASELAGEQIQFASGRAAIEAGSAALLDRLAREVRACPGTLRPRWSRRLRTSGSRTSRTGLGCPRSRCWAPPGAPTTPCAPGSARACSRGARSTSCATRCGSSSR